MTFLDRTSYPTHPRIPEIITDSGIPAHEVQKSEPSSEEQKKKQFRHVRGESGSFAELRKIRHQRGLSYESGIETAKIKAAKSASLLRQQPHPPPLKEERHPFQIEQQESTLQEESGAMHHKVQKLYQDTKVSPTHQPLNGQNVQSAASDKMPSAPQTPTGTLTHQDSIGHKGSEELSSSKRDTQQSSRRGSEQSSASTSLLSSQTSHRGSLSAIPPIPPVNSVNSQNEPNYHAPQEVEGQVFRKRDIPRQQPNEKKAVSPKPKEKQAETSVRSITSSNLPPRIESKVCCLDVCTIS